MAPGVQFFMVFPHVAVTWDAHFVVLAVQNLSFDMPGASILLLWGPFCQLGDTRGDHGRTQGGPEPDDGKHSPSDWSCSGRALAC